MHCISQVLIIHYKRFKPVQQGDQFLNIKLRHPVEAKPELYINGQKYDLVGVLVHQGESANSGHYFFDTVCPPYTTTRLAYRSNNDDRPCVIDTETLVDDVNNAYMLAYQKAAEPPREQPAAACVPPPAVRTPYQQKAEEVVDTTSDAEAEDPSMQAVSAATVPSTPDVTPQQNEVHPSATTSVPSTPKMNEDYFKDLLQERDAILSKPKADRSTADISRHKRLNEKIRKLKDQYPHVSVKQPAKTSAERKANSRQDETIRDREKDRVRARTASDEYKEKDCARKATDEYKEKTRARLATDEYKENDRARKASSEYKAADLQRKTAKKANVKVKARDGLKSGLILSGKFGVQTNSLGAMDKVNPIKQSQLKHTSLVTQCIN